MYGGFLAAPTTRSLYSFTQAYADDKGIKLGIRIFHLLCICG